MKLHRKTTLAGLIVCALVTLAACGGGGGSSSDTMNITPDDPMIDYTLIDQCAMPGKLQARFFGYDGTPATGKTSLEYTWIWPADSQQVYTPNSGPNIEGTLSLATAAAEAGIVYVCYGAQLEGGSYSWGLGIDAAKSCEACCVNVPKSGTILLVDDLPCP